MDSFEGSKLMEALLFALLLTSALGWLLEKWTNWNHVRTAAGLAAADHSMLWRFANSRRKEFAFMNKILVIGSSGNVGRALVEELARNGERVRAATRNPSKMDAPAGVEPVRFDYADPQHVCSPRWKDRMVFS